MTLPQPALPTRITLLATGGTIAGTSNATGRYNAAQLDVSHLLAHMRSLPGAGALRHCQLHAEQLVQADSKDMCWSIWQRLRQRVMALQNDSSTDAIVVLHGSDTLEETAFFLHASLALSKPLVITCAMLPADAPDADGPRNMLHSTLLAQQLVQSPQHDVFGVCAGKAWHAIHIRKQHTQAPDAFANALHPREQAAQWIAEAWQLQPPTDSSSRNETQYYRARHAALKLPQWTAENRPPVTATLCSHACADGSTAMQLTACLPSNAGLLVETTGSGTIHQALYPALSLAQDRGITLARSTRCIFGTVQHWPVPHSSTGEALQWLETPFLHSSKTRIWLALELLSQSPHAQ